MEFSKVIGQDQAKNLLNRASQSRMNILLVAPPGYGKTMLARIYLKSFSSRSSNLFGSGVLELNGTDKISNVLEQLESNKESPVLIDESHKLRNAEAIYKYLDDSPDNATALSFMRRQKNVFALATTDEGRMPAALVSRLVKVALKPYTEEQLAKIAGIEYTHNSRVLKEIATLSRGNPRRAILLSNLLSTKRPSNPKQVRDLLTNLGYPMGLDGRESEVIRILGDGPTGISNIAGLMSADRKTIRMIESDLIASGLITVSSKGRSLTPLGKIIAMVLAGDVSMEDVENINIQRG